jgi:hypothetical protein
MSRQLQPCGTHAAYARHVKAGEEPCEPCREARAAYMNEWNRRPPQRPRSRAQCGTTAGYARHWRNKEEACEACLKAKRAHMRDLRLARGEGGGQKLKPCGTLAAYRRHKAAGEKACGPCLEAYAEYYREWEEARQRRNHDRAAVPKELAPCGTFAAYQRHHVRGEAVDEACAQANRDYKTQWARNKRAEQRRRREAFDDALAEALADFGKDGA